MIQNAKVVAVGVDSETYHRQESQRGTIEFIVSPSQLKEFARCPDRWRRGYNPPGSDAKAYGSLLDCRLLTPELFEKRYSIKPPTYTDDKGKLKPFNMNATVCKDWAAEQAGREIVSLKEVAECDEAIARLRCDEVIASFVDASDKQVLVVAEWLDEETGLVVPIRCLLDLVPRNDTEFAKSLADLKCVRSAALIPFQRQCYQYGWHLQAAFDLDLYVAASGEDRCNWCFVIQESYEPWQPAKRLLSQDFVDIGRAEYKKHLSLYCACLKAGQWPSYDDNDEAVQGWSLCSPEPWMGNDGQFSPKLISPIEPTDDEEPDPDLIP